MRLRDNPKRLNIGKVESFLEKDTTELRIQFKKERSEIFKWCCDTWDDVSTNINKFTSDGQFVAIWEDEGTIWENDGGISAADSDGFLYRIARWRRGRALRCSD